MSKLSIPASEVERQIRALLYANARLYQRSDIGGDRAIQAVGGLQTLKILAIKLLGGDDPVVAEIAEMYTAALGRFCPEDVRSVAEVL